MAPTMRALVMAVVLGTAAPAVADPSPMYIRTAPAQLEVAPPAAGPPTKLSLPLRTHDEATERHVLETIHHQKHRTLMEQLRDRIYEELPVVSAAVFAPLPISTANGTLAGVGVIGKF
jgi:hypothetical protein